MWSFLHPEHERRVGELIAEALPAVHVTLSVDLLPQIREYTRTSTVAVNAYVQPRLAGYIGAIEEMLLGLGYRNPIRYVQSNGGLTSGRAFIQRAVSALNSGPAAGPSASLYYAGRLDRRDVLTLDMGGTSSDISLAPEGRVDLVKDVDIGRYRVGIPLVNVVSIGAGGGSIARLDRQGMLRVGPDSAEAVPGPACYMRGGTEATVTDALVVLGYLNQAALLGGRMLIDPDAARAAVQERVADRLRLPLERAAHGIFEVVNANMIGGIRSVSVERGHDPRDFCLVAGGGATSAHAGRLAAELGIGTTVVPRVASGLCAFGEAIADVKHTYLASYTAALPRLDPARLNELFLDLEARGRVRSSRGGLRRPRHRHRAHARHEVRRPGARMQRLDPPVRGDGRASRRHRGGLPPPSRGALHLLRARQHPRARQRRGQRVRALAPAARASGLRRRLRPPCAARAAPRVLPGVRRLPADAGLRGRRAPGRATLIDGPAIVEEETTTIVVFPGSTLRVPAPDIFVMSPTAP